MRFICMRNALKFAAFIGIVLLSSSVFLPFGEFYGPWS